MKEGEGAKKSEYDFTLKQTVKNLAEGTPE